MMAGPRQPVFENSAWTLLDRATGVDGNGTSEKRRSLPRAGAGRRRRMHGCRQRRAGLEPGYVQSPFADGLVDGTAEDMMGPAGFDRDAEATVDAVFTWICRPGATTSSKMTASGEASGKLLTIVAGISVAL